MNECAPLNGECEGTSTTTYDDIVYVPHECNTVAVSVCLDSDQKNLVPSGS